MREKRSVALDIRLRIEFFMTYDFLIHERIY